MAEDDDDGEELGLEVLFDRLSLGQRYDRSGRPIGWLEWARLFEDKTYQVIRQDSTRSGAWVSTVWLGLDHSWRLDEGPLIFETMVFIEGREDLLQERWRTEAEALEEHERIVESFGGRVRQQ